MAFQAKYPGRCRDCDDPITVGDWVEFDDDRNLLHQVCPEEGVLVNNHRAPRPLCPRCFLTLPRVGPCECSE